MLGLDDISKMILSEVADITDEPQGAYNFRVNSQLAGRHTTENIDISSKEDGSGIDIFIKSVPAVSRRRSTTTSTSATTAT